MDALITALSAFTFYYPAVMAQVWIIGSLYYYVRRERGMLGPDHAPALPYHPPVSLLVPCHNEGGQIRETIDWLLRQNYPAFEVIAIDDGSRDDTAAILNELADRCARLRVLRLTENRGKAVALRIGALMSAHEYLICVDGDALLDPNAVAWMMRHFIRHPRVGAVTGNPRTRNRSTLLGKIQMGEFSCIIGMIKRAQRVYGRVFTVSGVVAGFRKSALQRVGYWSTDMVTEDVDVSWKLQRDLWDIRYEPNARCWILMSETLRGLWRQRLRWAQGGFEVLIRNLGMLRRWRERRMWLVLAEHVTSIVWVYALASLIVLWLAGKLLPPHHPLHVKTFMTGPQSAILGITTLLQFLVGFILDSRYEPKAWKYYYWIVWYPIVYWALVAATTLVGVPKALLKRRGTPATWISPDRGLRP